MKNWTIRLLSTLVLSGVLASTVTLLPTASAKGCSKTTTATQGCAITVAPPKEKCAIMQGWEDAVKLTPAQASQVTTIRQAYQSEREHLQKQLHNAKETMRRLMEGSTTTAAEQTAVLSQARVVGALKTQLDTQHIKEAFEIKALLTPEQQKISNNYWHAMWERKEKMGYGNGGIRRAGLYNNGTTAKKSYCTKTKKPCCLKKLWHRSSKTTQSEKGCPVSFKHKESEKTTTPAN
jgi:Spy/CpxP family protein refolding chaperone